MNFVAGFLYFLLQNETSTFTFLDSLIEEYEMDQLFAQNVTLFKGHFYRLDRLIYFQHPLLSSYLRNEGINASLFSSAWFMTLFTNSLQFSKGEAPGDLLLGIWDTFLLYGWKAIYKAGLFILGKLKNELMETQFDLIMLRLSELPKSKFFEESSNAVEYKKYFKKIKVSNPILELLSEEYNKAIKEPFE